MPRRRLVRAVDAIAVEQPGPGLRQVAVPDLSVCSVTGTRVSRSASNRHSSTPVACSENSAKFTPAPSQVAPSG